MEPEITLHFSQQPLVLILKHNGYVCAHKLYFFKKNFYIFLPSSSKRSLSLTIPHQNVYIFLFCPIRSTRTAHLVPNLNYQKQFGDEYKSSRSLYNLFQFPVNASLVGPNIFQDTIFSKTVDQFSPLNVRNQ
jgi:hypothetical protein